MELEPGSWKEVKRAEGVFHFFFFFRVQASCKHVAALLFAVVEAVEEGHKERAIATTGMG